MSTSPLQPKRWDQQQEKGSFFVLRVMLWLYRYGGRGIFVFILSLVIWWYWLFAQTARKNSLDYLTRLHAFAQAQSPFDMPPTMFNSYQHLRSFGMSILDKMAGWLGDVPEQELQLFGHEHFRQYYQKGAILLVSHFGNIELLRAVKSDHVQVVNVLVYRKHAQQFNAFLQSINPKAAVRLISVDEIGVDTALLLQQRLDAGEWIVIAADRIPVKSNRQQVIDFLGSPAAWPEGAWLIAHLLQAPVLAVFCYPVQQKIQVHIHLISANLLLPRQQRQQRLAEYMQQYVALVQQHCLAAPYQWFNFYPFWGTSCQDQKL
ncbi:hypothetical protein GCM10023206_29920 [Acinetobacter puyangensis]|uniref:Predicted acyltransferase, LPLAT superfamily n=1 Tax=Acinetobacter puyangensis TaxID=1096779 RepID=A0A240E3Y9_9GAMM|nr:acyltransferase [Acinetobacter puyangensis]SNX43241.1 Predicted acyltransferase, LPLAT superfamily [Acinetobacter puyangensis]